MAQFARSILLSGLFVGLTSVAFAQTTPFTFTTFNNPLGTETQGHGINNAGQIVGNYMDGSGNYHGFLYNIGIFTTIDDPLGSVETQGHGINNAGQIVGNYFPGNGTGRHGFLYSGGIFTTIDDPSATGCCDQSAYSVAEGVNDAGQIVGFYISAPSLHGFLYSGGIFTTIDDPSATPQPFTQKDCCALNTYPAGINNAGQIVGSYTDGSGSHGFLYSGGIFTTIDDPSASAGTYALAINDAGQIVGMYTDGSGNHGFLARPRATSPQAAIQNIIDNQKMIEPDPTPITALTIPDRRTVELGPVLDKAAQYVAASKAPNTLRAYRGDWQRFNAWCAARGFPALPADPQTVALYIADLGGTAKPSTITRALAAIAKAHQAASHESPSALRHAAVKEVLSGIKRTHGTAQAGKEALLTDHLRLLIAALPDSLLGKRDAALLLLGFAGAFRRSELVALTVRDLEFCEDGLKVTLRRSKTDQEGQGRPIGVPYGSHPQLCPVRSLRRWLDASGIAEGPLFRGVTRHGRLGASALTDQVVRLIVQRYCLQSGVPATQFSAHSLRAGFVTQATLNGASERSIMNQTGHKNPAMVRRYTRDLNLFRDNAATRLGL